MPTLWRILPWLALLALVPLDVGLLATPLQTLFAHIPLNYNEGWNAFHTLRLRTGGPLYPPPSPAVFINYPPLSFYVIAAIERLTGDDIFAGRLVALVSLGVVTLNVALAARSLGVSRVLAAIAAAAFFAFVAIYYADYVAMNDPQWLGHAFQTTGLVILLRRNRTDFATLLIVALLFVAGGLVKQNLVALPLALTLWLAFEDRPALCRWLLIGLATVAVAAAACLALWGRNFVDQVLLSERQFWTYGLSFLAQGLALRLAPFIVFAAAGATTMWRERRVRLIGIYLLVALVAGVAILCIEGVSYSALFDLTIATMIGAPLLFDWLARRVATVSWMTSAAPSLAALMFTLPILVVAPHAQDNQRDFALDLARQTEWDDTIARIASAPGPVACETLALCYWAGRPSEIDFFNFGQVASLHPEPDQSLTAQIAGRRLALIQQDSPDGSSRMSASFNAAIAANYSAISTAPTVLLVPK